MISQRLNNFSEARIWINESPNIYSKFISEKEVSIKTDYDGELNEKKIVVELLVGPRDTSNYALLGISYKPKVNSEVFLKLKLSNYNDNLLTGRIAMSSDEVHAGIPEEYAVAIIEEAEKKIKDMANFPSGTIEFDLGAHAYVGSSNSVFKKITNILLELLLEDIDLSDKEKIKTIILKNI